MPKLTLKTLSGSLSVHQFSIDAEIPSAVLSAPWFSITRTDEETSVVASAGIALPSERHEDNWAALQVVGPLDFGLVGILAGISAVLAAAGTSIFAISTFNTDYILLKQDRLQDAIKALRAADYAVIE